jgi:hypothetical protein
MPNGEQQEFAPAFLVDIVEKGETFPLGDWPLHITLFPPLLTPYHDYYGDELRGTVNVMPPFDVTVGEDDWFGPDHDLPVKRIAESPRLRLLHGALVGALANLMHDPTYRRPYNPHISVLPGMTIKTGDTVNIGGFSIVEKTGRLWTVVDKIGLKGIDYVE